MNAENTKKLHDRFPVLYQNLRGDPRNTAMCWGFDHGDGWFNIVWQLSLAIEEELGYTWLQKKLFLICKKLSLRWNDIIYHLSPCRFDETKLAGSGTHDDPYHQVVVKKAVPTWDAKIANALFGLQTFPGGTKYPRSGLKALVWHPHTGCAVSQVKEKFGTLRFYSPGNDRIFWFIAMAEVLSGKTCEECGKYGRTYTNGWHSTLCEEHVKERYGPEFLDPSLGDEDALEEA
jgi:hypothetical protein